MTQRRKKTTEKENQGCNERKIKCKVQMANNLLYFSFRESMRARERESKPSIILHKLGLFIWNWNDRDEE